MFTTNKGKMLKGKDLITVGIFSALYFVINFAFMLISGFHPMLWILMPGLIAVFAGIPFLLMCTKVQKPGAVFLMGLITGFIYYVTGQFTLLILLTFVIGCGLGELIRACSRYGSFWGNALAYMALSGGQKQRLAVATAVLSGKKILIFDEPTSGLDYRRMKEVSQAVRKLAGQGHIVLVVSHDREFMQETCDRMLDLGAQESVKRRKR